MPEMKNSETYLCNSLFFILRLKRLFRVRETESYYKKVLAVLKKLVSLIFDLMTDSWNLQWLAVDNKKWSITVLNSLVKYTKDSPELMHAVKNHHQWIFNEEAGT